MIAGVGLLRPRRRTRRTLILTRFDADGGILRPFVLLSDGYRPAWNHRGALLDRARGLGERGCTHHIHIGLKS